MGKEDEYVEPEHVQLQDDLSEIGWNICGGSESSKTIFLCQAPYTAIGQGVGVVEVHGEDRLDAMRNALTQFA